jgi:hypothetical protein
MHVPLRLVRDVCFLPQTARDTNESVLGAGGAGVRPIGYFAPNAFEVVTKRQVFRTSRPCALQPHSCGGAQGRSLLFCDSDRLAFYHVPHDYVQLK